MANARSNRARKEAREFFVFIAADRLPAGYWLAVNGLPCIHNTHEAQASLVNQLSSEIPPRQPDSSPLTPLVFVNAVWRERKKCGENRNPEQIEERGREGERGVIVLTFECIRGWYSHGPWYGRRYTCILNCRNSARR